MKDYRVVMVSLEPQSDYWFVIWRSALCKSDLIREVNAEHAGCFRVDEYVLTEIMK